MDVSLPLDHDGFLRRECPHCVQQFKWHHGPANAEAEQQQPTESYHCPHCGQPAGPDSWWTQEQLDLINGTITGQATRMVNDMLGNAFKGMRSNNFVQVTVTKADEPDLPDPLVEPDDMTVIASPCHSWEPVKVPEDATSPFYCLVCGSAFAV